MRSVQYLLLVVDLSLAAFHLYQTAPPLPIVTLVKYTHNSTAPTSPLGERSFILMLRTSTDIQIRTDTGWKANVRSLFVG
jgi:hypothetical protein